MASRRLQISVAEQKLVLYNGEDVLKTYDIATATNGVGQQEGSYCTPLGKHRICAKIGAAAPLDAVFVGRQPTGEIFTEELQNEFPERDWILTRILWLEGLEPGVNQGGEVDTKQRYIYIHGSPPNRPMGQPGSKGCINLHGEDMIDLFNHVDEGDLVLIEL